MKLISEKGQFDSLATLRGAYLNSGVDMALDPKHIQGVWDESKLHVSDLGFCERRRMLRLQGAPKKVQNPLTKAMDDLAMWMGYRVHFLTYEALDWAGLLVGHEIPLYDGLWSGSADALFTPDYREERVVGYDCKTTRPKAYNYAYQYPKHENCLQVTGYEIKLPKVPDWYIEYVFFGSTNPPVECLVHPADYEDEALRLMLRLEDRREALLEEGEVPAPLPEKMVEGRRKVNGKDEKFFNEVTVGCNWECSYCPYAHTVPPRGKDDKFPPLKKDSPCTPLWWKESEVLAKKKAGAWAYFTTDERLRDEVERFIESIIPVVPMLGGQSEE